jgi:hypothetical protein
MLTRANSSNRRSRWATLVSVLTLTATLFAPITAVHAADSAAVTGDLNGDGVVDFRDTRLMRLVVRNPMLWARKLTAGPAAFLSAADLNGDGKVTAADRKAYTTLVQLQSPQAFTPTTGDLNFDGRMDQRDAQLLKLALRNPQVFQQQRGLTGAEMQALADMNNDGRLAGNDRAAFARTIQEARQIILAAAATDPSLRQAAVGGVDLAVVQALTASGNHDNDGVTPPVIVPTSDVQPAVTAAFASNFPDTYVKGSGANLAFSLSAALPKDGDVLLLAWSHPGQIMVDAFAHSLTKAPWRFNNAKLDALSEGSMYLQVLVRRKGQVVSKAERLVQIKPAPVAPSIAFASDGSTYQQGSDHTVAFQVAGELPAHADVLALAWNDAAQSMVNGFAHELPAADGVIAAAKLDALPPGRTQLQLFLRGDAKPIKQAALWVEVVAKPEPVQPVVVMPTATFAADAATTTTEGEAPSLTLALSGALPQGGDVLVQAWSHEAEALVNGFAHTLTTSPWQVSAAKLSALTPGRYSVQVLVRLDHVVKSKSEHTVLVQAKPAPQPEPQPEPDPVVIEPTPEPTPDPVVIEPTPEPTPDPVVIDPTPEPTPDPVVIDPTPEPTPDPVVIDPTPEPTPDPVVIEPTPEPTPDPVVIEPAPQTPTDPVVVTPAPEPAPEPIVQVNVAFASDAPAQYQHGSNLPINLSITGSLPAGGDVFLMAWSVKNNAMVDNFAHSLAAAPWQITAVKLDGLPSGEVELQAVARGPDQGWRLVRHTLTVKLAEGQTEPTPEPDPVVVDPTPTDGGWTTFAVPADARLIHVSASGNDANDGLSTSTPVRSLQRGYDLLRSGYPDRLLLKAGDVFTEPLPNWGKSGRSPAEPMVVGVYGNGERPRLDITGVKSALYVSSVHDVFFTGLYFHNADRDPHAPQYVQGADGVPGVPIGGGAKNLIFEDLRVEFFRHGFEINSDGNQDGLTIRRCIIRNNWAPWNKTGSVGIYAYRAKNLRILENVIDHNGWYAGAYQCARIGFHHNMYLVGSTGLVLENNFVARGSNNGLNLRTGYNDYDTTHDATIRGNVFFDNAYAIDAKPKNDSGNPPQVMTNINIVRNVFSANGANLDGATFGMGINVNIVNGAAITDNLLLDKPWTNYATALSVGNYSEKGSGPLSNVKILRNIIHRWTDGSCTGNGGAVTASGNLVNADPSLYMDAARSLAKYAQQVGAGSSADSLVDAAGSRARGQWPDHLTAAAVVTYLRAGFELKPFD